MKYNDIWLQFEKSQCSYNFSESSPDNLRKLFEIYQAEANNLIEKKLIYPALDFVLKCSHTFNLLDARGVISVTDRAQYIEKIRKLAREVASSWVEERELLEYPLIKIKIENIKSYGIKIYIALKLIFLFFLLLSIQYSYPFLWVF